MSLKEDYKKFSGGKASTMETVAWLAVQGHKAYKKLLNSIPYKSLECVKTASVADLEDRGDIPVANEQYSDPKYQFIQYAETNDDIINDLNDESSFADFLSQLRHIDLFCKKLNKSNINIYVVPQNKRLNEYLDILRKKNPQGKPDKSDEFHKMVSGLGELFVERSKNLIPGQLNPIQFGIMMRFGSVSQNTSLYFNFGSTQVVYCNNDGDWQRLCSLDAPNLFDVLSQQADIAGRSELNEAIPNFLS